MKQRIVITDGYTLNPGDLDWSPLNAIGEVKYFDRTAPEEVLDRCVDATIIITNKTPISASVIKSNPSLKLIAVTATGYNIVDVQAAKESGVIVCNVPGYGTDSVAQHTIALLLELTNQVGQNAASVRMGEWSRCPDFCYSKSPILELSGKKIGIIGFGRIGQKVGMVAEALGMKVLFFSPSLQVQKPNLPSIETVFAQCDVVSLHCPLTKDNVGFVNRSLLQRMKPSALLINTSRGQLINEEDLAWALSNSVIAGAAVDVLSVEPPPPTHPLLNIPNCIITPHNAWISFEARERIMKTTLENIELALAGKPQNIVS